MKSVMNIPTPGTDHCTDTDTTKPARYRMYRTEDKPVIKVFGVQIVAQKKGQREEDIKELSGRISKSLQEDKYKHTQTYLGIHRHTPQTSPSPWKIQCAPNVFWKPRQQDGCYLPRAPMDRLVGRRNPLGFYTFNVACCAHVHKLLRAPARAGNIHAL